MKPILRSVLAVLLGAIGGSLLMVGIETIGHLLYSPLQGIDPNDHEALKAVMANMPVWAFLFVLLAWGVGTFGGAWLAAWVGGRASLIHGLIVGVLFLIAGVANMLMLPHPVWFWIAAIAIFLPAAYFGAKAAEKKPTAAPPTPTAA